MSDLPASGARRAGVLPWLLTLGVVAFCVACLSIADMFIPVPYDGVVLSKKAASELMVQKVVPGSGAEEAGIQPGDRILGIGREVLRNESQAASVMSSYRIGDRVLYLVKRGNASPQEFEVLLGRRQIGDGLYFYTCALGFAFFFVGLFALVRQPGLLASQVFFWLGCLFLIFLVCRMRPPSYSGVDSWILGIGVLALLLLPPAFLHFYVLFPRPAWLEHLESRGRWPALVWLFRSGWPTLYLVPPLVFVLGWWLSGAQRGERWFGGAPLVSWWLLAIAVLLGLAALRANGRLLLGVRERRGVTWVLTGSIFGLLPFVASSLTAGGEESRLFLFSGLVPLAFVPLTFAYAIVRFQLLDIRIILRRSLLYTVSTAVLTGLYALGIVGFNFFFANSDLVSSALFPLILALAIVLLFDPLRRRLQTVIDRNFFAGQSHLQRAMEDLGEAMTARTDLQSAVRDLVEKLPRLLGFEFTGLYMLRAGRLDRVAGPEDLPIRLPVLPALQRFLDKRRGVRRLDQLGALPLRSPEVATLVADLGREGVAAVADLASRRRHLGMVLFSERPGKPPLEEEEQALLNRLLDQAAIALETGLLLEERTQKAELEREMEIAATIQAQLLPQSVQIGDGWRVAARCLPARLVGGDFFAQVPIGGDQAVIYGDVSGKSVSAAMMMMAAHEAIYTLAMAIDDIRSERLFELANRRLYGLGKRSFVALGLFASRGDLLEYLVAGQPPPLLLRLDGSVVELPLPEYRVPLGALPHGIYGPLTVEPKPGEVVFAYSDGVTDARSPEGEFFGEPRLFDILSQARTRNPEQLVKRVLEQVKGFTRGGLLYDDVTMLAIGRSDDADRSTEDWEELS